MANINFVVPDGKIDRVKASMKGLYPIPVVDVGTPEEPDFQPEFTDGQWAKEAVRRFIIRSVARWETKLAKDAANVPQEEDIAT